MDHIQSILNSVLFAEKFAAPNTAHSSEAALVHNAFWDDAYNRNLRLEEVEIEVRFGKLSRDGRGKWQNGVTAELFGHMMTSLHGYTRWSNVAYQKQLVAYFPTRDDSIRLVVDSDTTTHLYSKQKLLTADYMTNNMPFDFRLAVSVEIPMDDDKYTLDNADRVVTRERTTFTLGMWRYDLSRVAHGSVAGGERVEHQVEMELVDPQQVQLTHANAGIVAMQMQERMMNLMNACEPIRTPFSCTLCKKKYY